MEKAIALELKKKELVERLGLQMEKNHKLAPLAARILSSLILSGEQGMTFEGLVTFLNASKSTISNHLDHLQKIKKIEYFTKPGDRKRHFIISANLVVQVLNETAAAWEAEEEIQKEILDYKKRANQIRKEEDLPLFNIEFQENLLTYFREAAAAIKKLQAKIVNKRNH